MMHKIIIQQKAGFLYDLKGWPKLKNFSTKLAGAFFNIASDHPCRVVLYGSKVSAGFPSPAEDYIAGTIDLNELLINHPTATFLVRAAGNSMINAGIYDNDILVVDRSLEAAPGKIVIAVVDGEFTVKSLALSQDDQWILMPANPAFKPIMIEEGSELQIWGVVTYVLHAT